jgi:hypothetical protein
MKNNRITSLALCVALSALIVGPVFADTQEMEAVAADARAEAQAAAEETTPATATPEEAEPAAPPPKKPLVAVEDHHRFVEFGVDLGLGVANNMVGVNDILTKNIVLDLNALAEKLPNGGSFSLAPILAGFVLNVNIGNQNGLIGSRFGFGVFGGVDGGIYTTIGKNLFTMLSEGNLNSHNMDDDIVASGGLFAEAGIHAYANMNRWTFGVRPSVFFPVAYVPTAKLTWKLMTDPSFQVGAGGDEIKLYTPFDLDKIDVGSLFSFAGVDITLSARYALATWLNLGVVANHVPILPAKGDYFLTAYQLNVDMGMGENPMSDMSMNTDFSLNKANAKGAKESLSIVRPLTFDVYAEWQILELKFLAFTVKPNLGFTAMALSEGSFAFNWGVEGQLQLLRIFYFHVGTGLQDSLWRQRAGISFNFRFVELSLEATLQSQDFLNSFAAQGLGVNVGLRVGF